MGLFSSILAGYDPEYDDYDSPTAGTPRQNYDVPEDIKRNVVQKVGAEVEPKSVTGFLGNAAADVGEFASGLGSVIGHALVHPIDTAEAVGNAALHPIDTAEKLAQPFIDNYTPHEGEGIPSMLLRRAYDHPFDSLMDASFIVGGPASVAGTVAKATGAVRTAEVFEEVARRAAMIDPITLAQKTGRPIMKTMVPDAFARLRTSASLSASTSEEVTRQTYLMNEFNDGLKEASAHLNPAEMQIRFPYAEGRIPIIKDDMITEVTHRGALESRKVQAGTAIRPEALDEFVEKYRVHQEKYEKLAGLDPEGYANLAREKALREMDPADPEGMMKVDQAHQSALAEAMERKQRRSAKSTLTALDVAKEKNFREKATQLAVSQKTFDLTEINAMLPRDAAPTMDEALELMGPKGGVIVPHSGEVLTKDQSTVGNILTKVGEAKSWKENTGALFRSGALQQLDPNAALSRAYRSAIRGDTFGKIAGDAAEVGVKEGFAERMPKGWNPNLDPDVRAGTHQPLHPGSIHLDGTVGEHFERVQNRLAEVAEFDDAAKGLNLQDVAEHMAGAAEETFPLRADSPVYKIKKAMGDELAFYKRSFDPMTNPLAQISDKWVMGPFNLLNLSAKGTRILNNGYGNTAFIVMQGALPFSARGLDAAITAGRAMAGHFGLLTDEVSTKLGDILKLPGVAGGGLSGTEAFGRARDLGGRLAESSNPLLSRFGKYTQMVSKANENLENIYRGWSTIYEMKPGGMESVQNLIHSSASMSAFADRVGALRSAGVEAMSDGALQGAVKNMNRFLNDYNKTSAFDRNVARHVFPYHKFYKHSAELLLRFPFEKPIKGQLARAIGGAALQDTKDTLKSWGFDWNTMVPDYFRDSVPIRVDEGPDGTPAVMMLNTKGPNPFSFLSGSDVGEQGLAALHPLAKIALEQATGINMFTREKFQGASGTFSGRKVDPETGAIVEDYERPPLVDHYLRQFWPYQTLKELAAHGRTATDTADLLDIMSNRQGAFKTDDRGLARRKPQPFGALTPLARFAGPVPQVLQVPTARQNSARKAIVSEQFSDLLQQHPERREEILSQMLAEARAYRPGPATKPRRY